MRLPTFAMLFAFCHAAGTQQPVWQIDPTPRSGYGACWSFSDYDGDGYQDVLAARNVDYLTPQAQVSLCVLSGRDGSLLSEHAFVGLVNFLRIAAAGDHDGDGYDEYTYADGTFVYMYSPRRQAIVATFGPGLGEYGSASEARIDLNGDGRNDIVIASVRLSNSNLYAYDNSGALLYTLPASSRGWIIRSIATVGDLDGDGGEDYIVGALGNGTQAGGVFLVSGRTGTILRFHPGLQPFDFFGKPVLGAGDLDGDGVRDYVASSAGNGGFRHVIIAYSGATGGVLRQWIDPLYHLGSAEIADLDADLDGRPDISTISGIRSLRDGEMFMTWPPFFQLNIGSNFMAGLGAQPGNPYPVVALASSVPSSPYGTIRAIRAEPEFASLTGAACSSAGEQPTIGLRAAGTGSRIQLGSGLPGALAWCALGDGRATVAGGLPLPIALDPIGFTGCVQLVPLDFVAMTLVGNVGLDRGCAAFDIPQVLAGRGGVPFAAQWLVLDQATGTFATTQRHDFLLR